MRRFRPGLVLVFGGLVPVTVGAGQLTSAEGVVLEVGWQQGTVLLETEGVVSLAAVDPDATIDDPLGAIRGLSDLHPGDVVEYRAESFRGMLIVRELRVISISWGENLPEGPRRQDPRP